MTLIELSKDDVGTVYTFTLQDSAGTAINLTGKTVTLRYTTYPTAGSVTTRTLTVTAATSGICTWTTVAGDTATAGEYSANIEITSSGYQDTMPKHRFRFVVWPRV